jgi:hypothetical protein
MVPSDLWHFSKALRLENGSNLPILCLEPYWHS